MNQNITDCDGNTIKVGDVLCHPFDGSIVKITGIRADNVKATVNGSKKTFTVSKRTLARCQLSHNSS